MHDRAGLGLSSLAISATIPPRPPCGCTALNPPPARLRRRIADGEDRHCLQSNPPRRRAYAGLV